MPKTIKSKLKGIVCKAIEQLKPGVISSARVSVEVPDVPVLDWLHAQTAPVRCYMSSRENEREMAAIGIAHQIASFDVVAYRQVLTELNAVFASSSCDFKYFGGFSFMHGGPLSPQWQSFGRYRFILPLLELHVRSNRATRIFCNIVLLPNQDREQLQGTICDQIDDLRFDVQSVPASTFSFIDRKDSPERKDWCEMVEAALDSIRDSQVDKVVLARETKLSLAAPPTPASLLSALRAISPDCYHFLFQLDEHTAFLGATPEMLYYRRDRLIQSQAIAGTRARGESPEADATLEAELIGSDKERREHRFVADMIQETFQPYCEFVGKDAPVAVLKLQRLQHLFQSVSGLLKNETDDAEILHALHPTPAVGGSPREPALKRIQELEPFERGWYAAPVGWIGADGAGFAVAIRSALVSGSDLFIYAGAGIVEGSIPEQEWHEIENKISGFMKLIQPKVR